MCICWCYLYVKRINRKVACMKVCIHYKNVTVCLCSQLMKRQAAAKSTVEEKEPSPPPPTGVTKTRKTPKKKKKKDPNEPQK